MKSFPKIFIICAFGVVGCASKPPQPQYSYSDVANGRTPHSYNLFTPGQADSLNVYPKIVGAAAKSKFAVPSTDHGEIKKGVVLASALAAAKYLDPIFLFSANDTGCGSCEQLNSYSLYSKNALIYPGVGFFKNWKTNDSMTFGAVVDDVIAELTPRLNALGCKNILTADIGRGDIVLSDTKNYFIGKFECAEPEKISKNPRLLNTSYANTIGKEYISFDYQYLIVTRDRGAAGSFHASLISSCYRTLKVMKPYDEKVKGWSWYKKRYGESGPNITLDDFNECLVEEVAPNLSGWTKIKTTIDPATNARSMLSIEGPEFNGEIPSPVQSENDLNLMTNTK